MQTATHGEETLLTTRVESQVNLQLNQNKEFALGLGVSDFSMDKDSRWCVDSGATAHMCHDKSLFVELRQVKLAANKEIDVLGSGTVCLNLNESKVKLENTLYVPELRANLLSVMKAAKNGKKVIFDSYGARIFNDYGKMILKARKEGNLYFIEEEINTAQMVAPITSELMLWHMRCGHLNENDLKKLASKEMVKGLHFKPEKMPFCDVCAESKQAATPYPKSSNRSSSGLLNLVHSDICGPMRYVSNGGSRYFITFIDEYSNWVEVFFLKQKNEAINAFKKYKAMVENQTNCKIKCLRTDNGLEYCSAEFNKILEESGIRRELSTPYSPQQSGTAERMNRTLVEMARSMLCQSGLSRPFWAEAISTAAYIRNRCPSRKLEDKTPFERWHGYKPSIAYFKTFGCKAFVLQKKPGRDKFEPKAGECSFIGYSRESKAYRLWDIERRKVITARDVRFSENCFKPQNTSNRKIIRNDSLTEIEDPESERLIDIQLTRNEEDARPRVSDTAESEGEEDYVEPNVSGENRRRIGGRPSLLRTGQRGRPKKIYHYAAN